ncbi:hypothetical protein QNJ96_45395 (plasmid) [Bradyrhizobium elkanii]|nr:hypothetical protein [Bradyrhizobium elkanii]WLA96383.1 hypothetical protein QNJ96_45395 [Bradyrhizobium elkanii]
MYVRYKGGGEYVCNHPRTQEGQPTCQHIRADRCVSAWNKDPAYCRICECYPDGAVAAVDAMSTDWPRQVAFQACSVGGAVGGSGPT